MIREADGWPASCLSSIPILLRSPSDSEGGAAFNALNAAPPSLSLGLRKEMGMTILMNSDTDTDK